MGVQRDETPTRCGALLCPGRMLGVLGSIMEGVKKSQIIVAGRDRRIRGYLAIEGRTFRSKDVGRKRRIWQTAAVEA